MISRTEDWYRRDVYIFIKDNSKVSKEDILRKFQNDLTLEEELKTLIDIGKIKYIDGYYSVK
ncbi:hypothetical protein [Clostridium magnum]|uniref:Uncharacterized protein n=1 Tax=Clostridium magnum DSM 2767 TaxID=1121326 RepID=A0A162QPF2_9CLOT|nr:hypothetical protein [Clostridium magnum]KZL88785.1 hypothetical protein CLMAG_58780 [Clostridium magnum DSM 2767]SHJ57341.1 hypothetical protein SAMN02745944_06174 [Clostridium magnum DSM 2767]